MSESINITYDSIEFKDISDNILNSIVCDASGNLDISGGTLITQDISATEISCVNLTGNAGSVTNGVYTTDTGTVTNDMLSNNSVSFGGITLALGTTDDTPAFNLTDATDYPASSLNGTITNVQLAGSIADDKISSAETWNAKAPKSNPNFTGIISAIAIVLESDTSGPAIIAAHNVQASINNFRLINCKLHHISSNPLTWDMLEVQSVNGGPAFIKANEAKAQLDNFKLVNCVDAGLISISDDRLKHNEVDISNGLITVNKLNPKFYIKTYDIIDICGNEYSRNHNFTQNDLSNGLPANSIYESGYIAQDISNITELNHLVRGSEYDQSGNPTELGLNYTGIQPYLTKAIQELHALVLEQKQQILDLSAQVAALS